LSDLNEEAFVPTWGPSSEESLIEEKDQGPLTSIDDELRILPQPTLGPGVLVVVEAEYLTLVEKPSTQTSHSRPYGPKISWNSRRQCCCGADVFYTGFRVGKRNARLGDQALLSMMLIDHCSDSF